MSRRQKGSRHPDKQSILISLEIEIRRTREGIARERASLSGAGMPSGYRSEKIKSLSSHLDGLLWRRRRIGSFESRDSRPCQGMSYCC